MGAVPDEIGTRDPTSKYRQHQSIARRGATFKAAIPRTESEQAIVCGATVFAPQNHIFTPAGANSLAKGFPLAGPYMLVHQMTQDAKPADERMLFHFSGFAVSV